jgi:uncharacterized protein YqjF (DUF2071 family)
VRAARWERPPRRWSHATTTLLDFALLTWAVDPALVQPLLPDGFTVDIRAGAALISMVPFIDRRFRFRCLPFAPVTCGQVNYRTYVRHGGLSGVWFFGTSLDSVFVALPQVAWKMPWHRDRVTIASSWAGPSCESWELDASGQWGSAHVVLRGRSRPMAAPPGFGGDDDVSLVLCDPFVGWYARKDGSGVGRYSVWHQPLALEDAEIDEARVDVFASLGLTTPGQPPDFAGVQRSVLFDVHTPPIRETRLAH